MRRRFATLCTVLITIAGHALSAPADDRTGEQIWMAQCARCHGEQGQGVEAEYPDPLIGDKSIRELATVIDETMPSDDPESCVGPDAEKVAAYIYDAFYSPLAQARNRPAEVAFSRLTVPQYQSAVADLIASFRGPPPEWGRPSGLSARYSQEQERKEKRGDQDVRDENQDGEIEFERIDGPIDFDFGQESPNPETFYPEDFRINWSGAVYAPQTGEYEFIVETQNGMRLWLNDMDEPLIDGRVRSGVDVVWRETMTLLGRRCYAMRIEFFKSERAKEQTARIRLKWKPPHGAEEVIPARNLFSQQTPQLLIVNTPFPPDDRSEGYERGTTISREWDTATTYAAIEVAGSVAADLDRLVGRERRDRGRGRRGRGRGEEQPPPQEQPAYPDERVVNFCRQFVERAFRRPLSDDEQTFFIDRQFAAAGAEEEAVKRVVLLALKSPRFLYRETHLDAGGFDDYDVAAWLSFGLWDSLPDQPLLDAAARGELQSRDQIAAHVERMLGDPRARHKLREFLHEWLNLGHLREVAKDQSVYPEFNEQILGDLRVSLDLFLDDVLWSDASDYRQLLLADTVYLNGRLAQFYGVELPADAPFQQVPLNPEHRAGVLSHPYLMTGFAYASTTSPIHRGVFLSRNIMGRFLKPPQDAVSPVPPDLHPDLSTRERVALQTSPDACKVCHQMINGLGFSLENFDAVGRFRTEERGKPIDARGEYLARTGESTQFHGARDLAAYVADSEEAQTAFIEQLFRYLTRQPIQAFPDQLNHLHEQFTADNFHIRRLTVNLLTNSALALRSLHSP